MMTIGQNLTQPEGKTLEIEKITGQPGHQPLSLNEQNVLIGDYPKILDFQNLGLTYDDEIYISDSELVECIYLPAFTFIDVVIENLPNLREIHSDEDGPTWLACRNLPKLNTIIVDGSLRWLSVDGAALLQTIDVGKCEHLGYLSVRNAPSLSQVNVEQCRLLPQIDDLSAEHQIQLGVTQQIEAIQSRSKRDSTLYERMTFTDIELVLANISCGEVLLKKQFLQSRGASNSTDESLCDYGYRLLDPGEGVYTGGTGESYCYAFEVTSQGTAQDEDVVSIDYAVGIHEPEDAIGEALSWAASDLALSRDRAPSNDQVLSFINLLLNDPTAAPTCWIRTDDVALRLALAGNPLMPSGALDVLAMDKSSKIRLAVAENPAATVEVRRTLLHELAADVDPEVRLSVAKSAVTAIVDMTALAKDRNVKVLCAVAENPIISSGLRASVLEILSKSDDPSGLLLVAKSPDAPAAVSAFSDLLQCSDQNVIIAIAENIGMPESERLAALKVLAASEDFNAKWSVASNELTPPPVLDSLAKETNRRLLEAVAKNPATPVLTLQYLAKNNEWSVRCCVAENPSTPPLVLLLLAKDKDDSWGEYIRKSVAGNPAAPVAAFEILVGDNDWQTRASIAGNPAAPKAILELLARDEKYSVRENVAKNPESSIGALEILAKDKNNNLRMYVARHPASSSDILTMLAHDSYDAVRRDVATNKATPDSVLKVLSKEAETQVREAAERSQNRVDS